MTTLFLNVSFLVDKDLIKGSDKAISFSKSKNFPETNRDSPKAYRAILSKNKVKKKKK